MKMCVCAVRDSVSGLFALPMFVASKGVGMRMFSDEVNRNAADNLLFQHSGDFELCELGEFDNATGVWVQKGIELVCAGSDVKLGGA